MLVQGQPTEISKAGNRDKLSLSLYVRVISDHKGSVRTDQNIVGNFKLNNWLNGEAGFRYGERPQVFNSYYHYKLELQTKFFRKTVRGIARISDNVLTAPAPSYRKTNKLFAVEGRYRLSPLFTISGGGGYVFSSQQNNVTDVLPTSRGVQSNYPIFKLALKVKSNKRGSVEAAYGSYDVFNPYYYNSPFAQLSTEQELSSLCTFYSYFRYQYNNDVFRPNNYFFSIGIRLHLIRN